MNWKAFFVALVIPCIIKAHSNTDTLLQAKLDSAATQRFLTIGSSYGSNTTFFGRSAATPMPYLSTDIAFKSKVGLWLSASALKVLPSETPVDNIDLGAGFDLEWSERIGSSISYSKFFFNDGTTLVKSSTSNMIDLYMSFDLTHIFTSVGGGYIFGNEATGDLFLSLTNSRYFQFDSIFKSKHSLALEPGFSIIAGTQTFSNTYITTIAPVTSPIPTDPVPAPTPTPGRPGTSTGSTTTTTTTTTSTTEENTTSSTVFSILNYEISFPVTFLIGNFAIENSFRYTIPVNLIEGDLSEPKFIYGLSLYYTIKSK